MTSARWRDWCLQEYEKNGKDSTFTDKVGKC